MANERRDLNKLNRKQVFEYDIYIPLIPRSQEIQIMHELSILETNIYNQMGGLTKFTSGNIGIWKVGPKLEKDIIFIWRVINHRGKKGTNLIVSVKKELERLLHQKTILVVARKVEIL